jgi:hypothetical protein
VTGSSDVLLSSWRSLCTLLIEMHKLPRSLQIDSFDADAAGFRKIVTVQTHAGCFRPAQFTESFFHDAALNSYQLLSRVFLMQWHTRCICDVR